MGYELVDKFSIVPKFYDTKQSFEHFIFDYEKSKTKEESVNILEKAKTYEPKLGLNEI